MLAEGLRGGLGRPQALRSEACNDVGETLPLAGVIGALNKPELALSKSSSYC